MALTYDELKERYEKETLDFHGISKWHEMGYKGQGHKILNLEGLTSHGKGTLSVIELVSPESDISWCEYLIGCSGDKLTQFHIWTEDGDYNLEEFKEYLKTVDIVTYSKGGGLCKEFEELLLDNCICFTSAGNEGSDGLTGAFRGEAIDVGAIEIRFGKVYKESYSSYNCDFAFLHGAREGTSFSSPVSAGFMAVILSRYNVRLNNDKAFELFKSVIPKEYKYEPKSVKFGYGMPVLPDNGIVEMLESEVDNDMTIEGRFTVRYAHLDKILVDEGDMVNPTLPWKAATPIGVMGSTGISSAAHLHIDVVKYWQDSLWSLKDMYNGNKTPSKQELSFFVSPNDDTLFGVNPEITVEWDDQWYIDNYNKRHLAIDAVPYNRFSTDDNFTIYWNRSFAGRVLKKGYDYAYGNYVLIGYDTLAV